jgi:hypothetical protein
LVHLDSPYSGTQAQNQVFLEVEDILQKLEMPDGIVASPTTVQSRRVKIEPAVDGTINVRLNSNQDETFTIDTPEGYTALAELVGIPQSVVKRYGTKMTAPMVTHGLKDKEGLVVIRDADNRLLDIKDQHHLQPIIRPEQAIEKMMLQWPELRFQDAQVGKGNYQADILAITHDDERKLEDLLAPGLHVFLPDGGDPFRAGVHVGFNSMGITAPVIEPYLLRLVCRNGALHAEYLHEEWGRGYGEGDELWQWFRDGLQASDMAVNNIMDKYAAMVGDAIPEGDRANAVAGYIRNARLNGDDAQAVQAQAINEPPRNQYDLFNIATNTATHSRRNKTLAQMMAQQRKAAANIGEHIHGAYCPTCKK